MGDKLRANTGLIEECSRSLKIIHREFKNHSNPADDYGDALGNAELRDVFDEFSDTWKKTRKKLMDEIKTLAEATATAAEKYDEVDRELEKALRDAAKEKRRGKK
ncbi:hypothetical protein [Streptomyces sp. 7N604]|uniref:hypothetical protein n=1 Tax=Streptomyces sp. 7N604 TaxID=3457415 RepID=UPI003FD4474B